MLIPKIAFRNIFKQRRRSFFTGLTMAMGFVLLSASFALVDGGYGGIIDRFTRDHTGHVQVHVKGYLDRPSIYKTLPDSNEFERIIRDVPGVTSLAPRIRSSALAFIDKKTTGLNIVGIDPEKEQNTTRITRKVTHGEFLKTPDTKNAVIGGNIAEILNAEIGSSLILITQAADGSIANDVFTVCGIIRSENDSFEQNNCYLPLRTAQEFLCLGERIHEAAVITPHHALARETARAIQDALHGAGYNHTVAEPWQEVERQFYLAMQADKKGNFVSLVIIMIIVSIGVLNTVLMEILERTREFGVIAAMGTRPVYICLMIILEMFFLSLFAAAAGAGISFVSNSLLATYGITYPEPVSIGGITFDSVHAVLSMRAFVVPAILIVAVAFCVSILPAIRASRIDPVKAMRTF